MASIGPWHTEYTDPVDITSLWLPKFQQRQRSRFAEHPHFQPDGRTEVHSVEPGDFDYSLFELSNQSDGAPSAAGLSSIHRVGTHRGSAGQYLVRRTAGKRDAAIHPMESPST